MDPRTLGTQIDDSIMDKSLDAKLLSMNKNYLLDIKTKVLDGRIIVTGKVDTPEEKLKIFQELFRRLKEYFRNFTNS